MPPTRLAISPPVVKLPTMILRLLACLQFPRLFHLFRPLAGLPSFANRSRLGERTGHPDQHKNRTRVRRWPFARSTRRQSVHLDWHKSFPRSKCGNRAPGNSTTRNVTTCDRRVHETHVDDCRWGGPTSASPRKLADAGFGRADLLHQAYPFRPRLAKRPVSAATHLPPTNTQPRSVATGVISNCQLMKNGDSETDAFFHSTSVASKLRSTL